MISRIVLVLAVQGCASFVASHAFLGPRCDGAEAIGKYVDFAKSLVSSSDDNTRSRAVYVLLADGGSDRVELLRKSLGDRAWIVRIVALQHLTSHPANECVPAIRDLLAATSRRDKAHHDDNDNTIAQLAARALLESKDQQGARQAIEWIEAGLAVPSELGRWGMAAELAGTCHISQMKAYLAGNKFEGNQEVMAAAALAKLGDVPSQQFLRQKLNDPGVFQYVVHDFQLLKLLKLSLKDVKEAITPEKQNDWIKVVIARACAYLGEAERLHELARQLPELALKTAESRVSDKLLSILGAIGDVGDESMIPELEKSFAAVPDDGWRLDISLAIVKVSQREKARKAGKETSTNH